MWMVDVNSQSAFKILKYIAICLVDFCIHVSFSGKARSEISYFPAFSRFNLPEYGLVFYSCRTAVIFFTTLAEDVRGYNEICAVLLSGSCHGNNIV